MGLQILIGPCSWYCLCNSAGFRSQPQARAFRSSLSLRFGRRQRRVRGLGRGCPSRWLRLPVSTPILRLRQNDVPIQTPRCPNVVRPDVAPKVNALVAGVAAEPIPVSVHEAHAVIMYSTRRRKNPATWPGCEHRKPMPGQGGLPGR